MITFYWFILGVLGVWRITHMLNAEDGPGQVFVWLRQLTGASFLGELLDCFYCLSLWTAVPFAWLLASRWRERLLLWPALSGAAILLERMHGPSVPAPDYVEDPESKAEEKETGGNP